MFTTRRIFMKARTQQIIIKAVNDEDSQFSQIKKKHVNYVKAVNDEDSQFSQIKKKHVNYAKFIALLI